MLRKVKFSDIQPGPVRGELTDEQSEKLKTIYKICGHLNAPTLEEFELGFMRDLNPDNEIRIWSHISLAFYKAMQRYPKQMPKTEAEMILTCFILMSMNGPDTQLPDIDQVEWLRECWRNPEE